LFAKFCDLNHMYW